MKRFYSLLPVLFLIIVSVGAGQSWQEQTDKFNSRLNEKKYAEALDFALSALNSAEKEFGANSKQYALTLGNIGEVYYYIGRYDDAIDYLSRSKDLKKDIFGASDPAYALSINNLSVIYLALGRYGEAEPLLLEALRVKKASVGENDTSYARSLNNYGQCCLDIGKYPEAEQSFLSSLKIKKEKLSPDHPSLAYTLFNLGILYKTLGNYEEAEKDFAEALRIVEKFPASAGISLSNARYELAMNYIALNQEPKARALLEKIKSEQLKDMDESHPDYAKTLYNLALLQWSMKNYREAEDLLIKTKSIVEAKLGNGHPLYAACLNSLGVIYWQQNKLEKAYENLSAAVSIRERIFGENHPDYATSVHNLAGLLKEMGRFDEAEAKYRQAFTLYMKQIKKCFPFMSENEKSKFYTNLKERFDVFNCYAITRLKDNPSLVGDMYDYRLATKGILLNSVRRMNEAVISSNDKILIEKFNRWQSVKGQLSRLYSMTKNEARRMGANTDSLETVSNRLEKELSAESSGFAGVTSSGSPGWKDIRSALKPDEAAVELIRFNFFSRQWTDTVMYAALIVKSETRDHPEIVLLTNGRQIEDQYIKDYRNSITRKAEDKDSYQKLWADIDDRLKDKKKIFVSLDGVYNKVNLNTLRMPDGKYLIDRQDIVIVNNTSDIMTKAGKRSDSKHKACLFGYPKFELAENPASGLIAANSSESANLNPARLVKNITINDLPGTKSEIEQIASILKIKNWSADIFTEEKASKTNLLKVASPYVLHVATHGFFLSDINLPERSKVFGIDFEKASGNPLLRSGLLLAGAANTVRSGGQAAMEDNGIFSSYEAMNMNLEGTRLIVLSACETGLGEIKNGEGVYGLQRSLLAAGAENVLMSLWNVNDQITQELMSGFYKNWLTGDSMFKAFKKAQSEIKEKYPLPYYWGSFVLVGKGE